jgi:hypothetical protein
LLGFQAKLCGQRLQAWQEPLWFWIGLDPSEHEVKLWNEATA